MAQCSGKVPYSSERKAQQAAFAMWGKDPRLKIGELHAYLCPECGRWHVGHLAFFAAKQSKSTEEKYEQAE